MVEITLEKGKSIEQINSSLKDIIACTLFHWLLNSGQISYFFFLGGGYVLFQGATIRRDEHTGAVIVARIMRGGAADRSGMVAVEHS